MQTEKAERIIITLPPDMLAAIKKQVSSGSYGSTSEVITMQPGFFSVGANNHSP